MPMECMKCMPGHSFMGATGREAGLLSLLAPCCPCLLVGGLAGRVPLGPGLSPLFCSHGWDSFLKCPSVLEVML